MSLIVKRAGPEDRGTVGQLLQLCLHDYTEFDPFEIGSGGRFQYRWFDEYWTSARRHPYLFESGTTLAGFAFVREAEEDTSEWDFEMAEFFVLRSFRRKTLGQAAARILLRRHTGVWEISYDVKNHPARAFWKAVVAAYDPLLKPIPSADTRERYLLRVR